MNDRLLIRKIKSDGSAGLSDVYKMYRSEFIGWLCKEFRCTSEEAKEVYQSSILILYKNVVDDKFQGNSSVKTYLFGIGRNQLLRTRKEEQKFSNAILDNVMDDVHEEKESKELYEANLEAVHKSLQSLGDPCKKLLELSYFHKKSMREISEHLGYKNEDTAKNLKYKCLQRLKNLVQQGTVDTLRSSTIS